MSRDKQNEEMARDMCNLPLECDKCSRCEFVCKAKRYAKRAIDKGYRKASEVALEVIEYLEDKGLLNMEPWAIAELKKKHIGNKG